MPRPGRLTVEKTPKAWVLALYGEHDVSTVGNLSARIDAALAQGHSVVVDLTGITFIDSTMVGAVFAGRRSAETHGRSLVVVAPGNEMSRRLIDLVHMSSVVPVHETVTEALAALQ